MEHFLGNRLKEIIMIEGIISDVTPQVLAHLNTTNVP